jgi:hypothetical protein
MALVGIQGENVISGADDLPTGYEVWIVKFAARTYARCAGSIGYGYSLTARAAGINKPPPRRFAITHGRDVHR